MAITPDSKDWTWVLDRPCPECGVDVGAVPRERLVDALRQTAEAWPVLLADPELARRRPSPDVWSGLEYACHVRDVYRLFDHRLDRMLAEDDPLFANWDQDATAVRDGYAAQDPATVNGELTAAATALAARLAQVTHYQWQRTGRRSDGAFFTVESFARYLLHDPAHHVHDVTVGYRRLAL
ncbi:MAG TPA: DinB family protein [Actinomycetes bacterium]